MDFFARQDQARKNTKKLVVYFALAVVMISIAVYPVVLMISLGVESKIARASHEHADFLLWNPRVFVVGFLGTLAVIFVGSAFKINQIAGGGSAVCETLGGRLVASNTIDLAERRLLNVVEEMAIASGIPVPQVYVLDREEGINAFAAGHTTSDAAIGVTRGCIKMLKREELQGVIGHEFSHILNGDMRLNIRLLGIIFGILCIATIGRIFMRARGRNAGGAIFAGVLLLIIGSIGVFFGRLIQAAVSRQREFLADASSVQFTRNPLGLSGALQKIGSSSYGSRLESEHAADVCHMFFGNGVGDSILNVFATHPPIDERIRAIDATWDGKFPPITKEQAEVIQRTAISDMEKTQLPRVLNTILGGAIIAEVGSKPKPPVIKSSSVMPNLGKPTPLHLRYAEELRDSLPENLKLAAHESSDAAALIYAVLLSHDEATRARQLAELGPRTSPAIQTRIAALFSEVAPIATRVRLPLVDLALPALRRMTSGEFKTFSETLHWLVQSDQQIEVFEFTLQKIVLRHLGSYFGETRRAIVQFYSLKPLLPDCAVLLSALAYVGSADAAQSETAFQQGAPYLRATESSLEFLPLTECGVDKIDAALNRLDQAVPQIKKNLLEACVRVVGADGVIQEREAELLRAIADTIDCPMPPIVPA